MSTQQRKKAEEAAAEFDRKFDDGEDITEYLEWSTAHRPGHTSKRVNVDFPQWMVDSLDSEAKRLGVTRQSIIMFWLAERLESTSRPEDRDQAA